MPGNETTHNAPEKSGRRFLQGALILTVAGVVVKIIGSLNWIFLSWILGGEGIGIYQIAFPLYLLALSLSEAGIPVAVSILTAERAALKDFRGATRVFHLSFLLLAVTGLLLSLLLYFGADWLIDHRVIRDARAYYSIIALTPAIFLVTVLSSFRGYLQGWQMMTPTAVSQIIEQMLRVFTMLLFAHLLLPRGLEFAAGGASLGAAVGAVGALLVLIWYYYRLQAKLAPEMKAQQELQSQEGSLPLLRRIASLALPVALSSLMLPVVANLDLFIVPLRLEVAGFTVGQATERFGYLTGMAVPLVNLATIVTASLAVSLVPAISQAKSLGQRQEVAYRTAGAMRLANITTIPLSVMLWIMAEPVVTMIYHAPGAAGVTKVMAFSIFLLGLHQVTTGVLQGMGRTSIPVINMGLAAGVKVALNWVLTAIPSLGIQGAALATLADLGLAAALNLYFVYRYTGYFFDCGDLMKNIVSAAVMGAVMHFGYPPVMNFLDNRFLAVGFVSLVGAFIYLGVMILTGGLNRRDLVRIPVIGPRLFKDVA
ncbi:MAG: spoVB 2 [Firmicutes bacterium]|nr:spoVB 2 [Bacillota bacterium]